MFIIFHLAKSKALHLLDVHFPGIHLVQLNDLALDFNIRTQIDEIIAPYRESDNVLLVWDEELYTFLAEFGAYLLRPCDEAVRDDFPGLQTTLSKIIANATLSNDASRDIISRFVSLYCRANWLGYFSFLHSIHGKDLIGVSNVHMAKCWERGDVLARRKLLNIYHLVDSGSIVTQSDGKWKTLVIENGGGGGGGGDADDDVDGHFMARACFYAKVDAVIVSRSDGIDVLCRYPANLNLLPVSRTLNGCESRVHWYHPVRGWRFGTSRQSTTTSTISGSTFDEDEWLLEMLNPTWSFIQSQKSQQQQQPITATTAAVPEKEEEEEDDAVVVVEGKNES